MTPLGSRPARLVAANSVAFLGDGRRTRRSGTEKLETTVGAGPLGLVLLNGVVESNIKQL